MSLDEHAKKQLFNLHMVNKMYAEKNKRFMYDVLEYEKFSEKYFKELSNTIFETNIGIIKL